MPIVRSHKEVVAKIAELHGCLERAGRYAMYICIHPSRRIVAEHVLYRDTVAWNELPEWEAKLFNMEIITSVGTSPNKLILMDKKKKPLLVIDFPYHIKELEETHE